MDNLINLAKNLVNPIDYSCGVRNSLSVFDTNNIIALYRFEKESLLGYKKFNFGLFHNRYALTINMQGDSDVFINGDSVKLHKNHALLIFPYQFHSYLPYSAEFNWVVFTFENSTLLPNQFKNQPIPISPFICEISEKIVKYYLEYQILPTEILSLKISNYLNLLLTELYEKALTLDTNIIQQEQNETLLEKIVGYIHSHFQDSKLSLKEIARIHNISQGYLCALFKIKTSYTIGNYIRKVRINNAIKLLQTNEFFVNEIAEKCGFSSHAIFCRCFKQQTGSSPQNYTKISNNS